MKNLLAILLMAFTLNAGATTIYEATDPTLDAEFLDAGVSNLDTSTGLYWLNFSDLVAGDLTLGYSIQSNEDWFGPQGWRLPTYQEVDGLFNTFFEPEFVDSGNGTMVFGTGHELAQKRNSWIMDFGTDATEVTGSTDPNDAIINSIGLYLDANGDVQMMGVEFDAHNLITTIYGMDYKEGGLDINTAYYTDNPTYGVFMVYGAVVPIPAAIWLFGSGLIGLLFVARRKS